jgi:hypothetical protein
VREGPRSTAPATPPTAWKPESIGLVRRRAGSAPACSDQAASKWASATRTLAQTDRSNIQAGTSSQRSASEPLRLQRKQCHPISRSPRERRSEIQTPDVMGTAILETRFRGRSQALLYNTIRPRASIGYKPAPEVFVSAFAAWRMRSRPAPPATLAQPPTLNRTDASPTPRRLRLRRRRKGG